MLCPCRWVSMLDSKQSVAVVRPVQFVVVAAVFPVKFKGSRHVACPTDDTPFVA